MLQKQIAGLLQHVKSSKLRKDSFAELLLKTTDVKTGELKCPCRLTALNSTQMCNNYCLSILPEGEELRFKYRVNFCRQAAE